ncbi:MAG TPA: alpha/beta hydrolase, partial [Streptosporangiaceae bacterium]
MIELPLPPGVERLMIETSRRRVQALRGVPRPEVDNGIDVVMVSGFFGTKEDYRELLSLLAAAGFRGWAYDYAGQLELATA